MFLPESAHNSSSFANLLNYAAVIDEGIILLKDGAFLTSWYYEPPDVNSASFQELANLSAHINHALSRLGNGWVLNVDAVRQKSIEYPDSQLFPHPVTALIDLERKEQYVAEINHFETVYVLSLTYKPPKEVENKVSSLFVEGNKSHTSWTAVLEGFKKQTANIEAQLSAELRIRRMLSEELLTFLHTTITGDSHPVGLPEIPMYLDSLLASEQFIGGFCPKIGKNFIAPIAVMGFPAKSYPQILSFLDTLPIEYRWSTRFIFLDPHSADKELKKYRKHWFQKRHGLTSFIKESFNMPGQTFLDQDALAMANDANEAVALASSNTVRFGFYTSLILLFSNDRTELNENAQLIKKHLQHHGFPARIEEINAIEAYLGSLPGHGYPNIRRPLIHTLNLADLLPLGSVWPGLSQNPSPLFPANSPPLLFCATTGSTPFRLNLHVSDVGHTLIVGPTGAGKSTLLGLIMAQFFRYAGAQVFCFDKGYSAYALCKAAKGVHYNLCSESDSEAAFYPLASIDSAQERIWAADWLEVLCNCQGINLSVQQRTMLNKALKLLSVSPSKTLTDLNIQDTEVRLALSHYTLTGGFPLLDAATDALKDSRFQVFELEHLLSFGDKNVIPVLLYLFHCIDKRLTGAPTLIILEEAWSLLLNSTFSEKIEEWLRTLRKKNAAVVFVTQSLAEIARSKHSDLIIESCPTKIFLPNPEASSPHNSELYSRLGLTERQIEIITEAVPKRHYYYSSPLGKRLVDLTLGPATLSFIGVGSPEDIENITRLSEDDPHAWQSKWLMSRGLKNKARQLKELTNEAQTYSDFHALLSSQRNTRANGCL